MPDTKADRPRVFREAEKEAQPEHAQDESKHALFGPQGRKSDGTNKEIALHADGSHAAPFVAIRAAMLKNDVCWFLRHVFGLVRYFRVIDIDVHCLGCPDQRIVAESSRQTGLDDFIAGLLLRRGIKMRSGMRHVLTHMALSFPRNSRSISLSDFLYK